MSEKGAVMAEAALVSMLLLTLFTGVFEISRLIYLHTVLTEAAHEAGRLGARIQSLPTTQGGALNEFIEARARILIGQQSSIGLNRVSVRSSCKPITYANGYSGRVVELELDADYIGLFAPYLHVPLKVSHLTSYLGGASCG